MKSTATESQNKVWIVEYRSDGEIITPVCGVFRSELAADEYIQHQVRRGTCSGQFSVSVWNIV